MMPIRGRRIHLALVSVAAGYLVACGQDVTGVLETEHALYYLKAPTNSGDGQSDTVFATLPLPFRVLVRRADAPAVGIKVVWEIDGDTLTGTPTIRDTSLTDASGIATSPFHLTLGRTTGIYAVRARVPGLVTPGPIMMFTDLPCGSGLCFNATARAGKARQLQYVSGDNQLDTVGTKLEADYVVRALDTYGNAASGTTIAWAVTAGNGSIAAVSDTTTSPYGLARARHTLGPTDSVHTATATAVGIAGVPPVVFTATGFTLLPVASVTVTPESAMVAADKTVQLTAVLRDANGRALFWRRITWTSDDPAIASVDTAGLVRGTSPGTTIVVAESEGISDTAAITVTEGPPPAIFASIVAGFDHSCGLRSDGTAHCWGTNDEGELGNGSTVSSATPVAVVGGLTFTTLVAGGEHTCGLTSAGIAYCWGRNGDGQLGDSSYTNRSTPVAVKGGQTFSSLGTGAYHTCGVVSSGAGYCWGWGDFGQLGIGSYFVSRNVPTAVVGGLRFVSIGTGPGWHSCGITVSGAAYCWGGTGDGQLGNGSFTQSSTPVAVVGGLSFSSIKTNFAATCALTSGNAVYCWGDNHWNELGDSSSALTRATPGPVTRGSGMVQVTSGTGHSCAISTAGIASCWGQNYEGQVGDGTRAERPTPAAVFGGFAWAAVAAGGDHTCGLTSTGVAYCWGANRVGQLGDGTTTNSPLPVRVVGEPLSNNRVVR